MVDFNADVKKNYVNVGVENVNLTVQRAKILELIRGDPKITVRAMAEELGITPRNTQVHIRALKTLGLVKRVGAPRSGRWEVRRHQALPDENTAGFEADGGRVEVEAT
jgi:predicted HTH transcriptional regulator